MLAGNVKVGLLKTMNGDDCFVTARTEENAAFTQYNTGFWNDDKKMRSGVSEAKLRLLCLTFEAPLQSHCVTLQLPQSYCLPTPKEE